MADTKQTNVFNNVKDLLSRVNTDIMNFSGQGVLSDYKAQQLVDMKNFVQSREQYLTSQDSRYGMMDSWSNLYSQDTKSALKTFHGIVNIEFTRHIRYLDYDMMEVTMPEISTALDIYANYIVRKDQNTGNYLTVVPQYNQIEVDPTKLQLLQLEINVLSDKWGISDSNFWWKAVRDCLKYGDSFLYNTLSMDGNKKPTGIQNVELILPYAVDLIANPDRSSKILGYNYKPKAIKTLYNRHMASGGLYTNEVAMHVKDTEHSALVEENEKFLTPLEMIHLAVNKGVFAPYGTSLLEGARKNWKQLLMMEDALAFWTIQKGVQRRVFFIDTGNLPPNKAEQVVRRIRDMVRKKPYVEPSAGDEFNDKSNWSFNILAQDEDLWIPIRPGSSTKVDTLPELMMPGLLENIKYVQDKVFAKLGVPKAFLTYDSDINAKGTLLVEDSAFADTIFRLQTVFAEMIWSVYKVHYYLAGRLNDILDVKATFLSLDSIIEQKFLEVFQQRVSIASSAMSLVDPETSVALIPIDYVLRTIVKLPENSISVVLDLIEKKKTILYNQSLSGGKDSQPTQITPNPKPFEIGGVGGVEMPQPSFEVNETPIEEQEPKIIGGEEVFTAGEEPETPTEEVPAFESSNKLFKTKLTKNQKALYESRISEQVSSFDEFRKALNTNKLSESIQYVGNSDIDTTIFGNNKPFSSLP